MNRDIEIGQMAFITGRVEAAGAVRGVSGNSVTIYVENSGDFDVPFRAVTSVHDGKIDLDPAALKKPFLDAVGHVHDREDPNVAG